MKRLIALGAAVLAACLVAVGCGGGGDDASTASLTKAEFIKQANAVCKKGEEQIETDFAAYVKGHEDIRKPTEADFSKLVDSVLVPNAEKEIEDLRALGLPSGDEDQVEAILEAREESVEAAEDEPEVVVKDGEKVFGKASELAISYGLEDCGNR